MFVLSMLGGLAAAVVLGALLAHFIAHLRGAPVSLDESVHSVRVTDAAGLAQEGWVVRDANSEETDINSNADLVIQWRRSGATRWDPKIPGRLLQEGQLFYSKHADSPRPYVLFGETLFRLELHFNEKALRRFLRDKSEKECSGSVRVVN